MKLHMRYIALGTMACGLLSSGLAARADEFNLATKITFSQPVEIPGMVLAAGTYTFKLADPDSDQSTLEILNGSQSKVYATLETVAALRSTPTSDTEVKLDNLGNGNVPVLTEWFYPGRATGREMLYSSKKEALLKQAKVETVIAQPATATNMQAGE